MVVIQNMEAGKEELCESVRKSKELVPSKVYLSHDRFTCLSIPKCCIYSGMVTAMVVYGVSSTISQATILPAEAIVDFMTESVSYGLSAVNMPVAAVSVRVSGKSISRTVFGTTRVGVEWTTRFAGALAGIGTTIIIAVALKTGMMLYRSIKQTNDSIEDEIVVEQAKLTNVEKLRSTSSVLIFIKNIWESLHWRRYPVGAEKISHVLFLCEGDYLCCDIGVDEVFDEGSKLSRVVTIGREPCI